MSLIITVYRRFSFWDAYLLWHPIVQSHVPISKYLCVLSLLEPIPIINHLNLNEIRFLICFYFSNTFIHFFFKWALPFFIEYFIICFMLVSNDIIEHTLLKTLSSSFPLVRIFKITAYSVLLSHTTAWNVVFVFYIYLLKTFHIPKIF